MLFPSIVYGPIRSRRLGISLGMNIMPVTDKLCTFDCIYCECGFNTPVAHPVLPSRQEVYAALETCLEKLSESEQPDVITFSGNGEPTLHPDFEGIITDTCRLRDRYCPKAQVCVLSNSTQLGRADVVRALRSVDQRILKLDSAIETTMHAIDCPVNRQLTVDRVVEYLKQFDGDFTLQTCFLRGTRDGNLIDNSTDEEVQAWYRLVEELHPKKIMIYVIDRATPVKTLEKITRERMEAIAAPLREKGYSVDISA